MVFNPPYYAGLVMRSLSFAPLACDCRYESFRHNHYGVIAFAKDRFIFGSGFFFCLAFVVLENFSHPSLIPTFWKSISFFHLRFFFMRRLSGRLPSDSELSQLHQVEPRSRIARQVALSVSLAHWRRQSARRVGCSFNEDVRITEQVSWLMLVKRNDCLWKPRSNS
jgi:hypothetical protein